MPLGALLIVLAAAGGKAPPAFHLEPALLARAHALAKSAAAPASDDQLCAQLADTRVFAADLTKAMDAYFTKSGISADDADDAVMDAVHQEADRAAVPGVVVTVNNHEFVEVDARFDVSGLLKVAHISPAAAPFLIAAAPLENGLAVSLVERQVTDVQVCGDPGALAAQVPALGKAWSAAPACLQKDYLPRLQAALDEIAGQDCFCDAEPQVKAQRAEIAHALATFPKGTVHAGSAKPKGKVQYGCTPN